MLDQQFKLGLAMSEERPESVHFLASRNTVDKSFGLCDVQPANTAFLVTGYLAQFEILRSLLHPESQLCPPPPTCMYRMLRRLCPHRLPLLPVLPVVLVHNLL